MAVILAVGCSSFLSLAQTSTAPERANQDHEIRPPARTLASVPATSSNPSFFQPAHTAPLHYPDSVVTSMPAPEELDVLGARPLYQFNERNLDIYLAHLAEQQSDPIQRLIHLARKSVGQSYQADLLGEFPFEIYDPDPLYNLARSDALSFCEQSYAMALSNDWVAFFRACQRLRYRKGNIGLRTRNHDVICDWNRNNAWLFNEHTKILQAETTEAVVTSRTGELLQRFGVKEDSPEVRVRTAYVPREFINAILPSLEDGDFIQFLGDSGAGDRLAVQHVGIAVRISRDAVNLIHSAPPSVREEPLLEYKDRDKSILGMKVLRLKASPQHIMERELRMCSIGTGR